MAWRRGAVDVRGLGTGQLEGRAADPVRLVVHGAAGPLAGQYGDAGTDHRRGRDITADRNSAWHLGGHLRWVQPRDHTRARFHADSAVVRLPRAADAGVPDRTCR